MGPMRAILQYLALLLAIPALTSINYAEAKAISRDVTTPQDQSPDEIALRNIVNEYYTTIAKKDWQHLTALGLETSGEHEGSPLGPNICLEFLKRTLDPTTIERLEFEIGEISVRDKRATLHVLVTIKASKEGSDGYQIQLTNLRRKLVWEKTSPDAKSASGIWRIRYDSPDYEDLSGELISAKSDAERELQLVGGLDEFDTIVGELSESAAKYAFANDIAKSLKNFRLAQFVLNLKKEQEAFSSHLMIRLYETKARQYSQSGDTTYLAPLMHSLGLKYNSINDYGKALEYLNKSLSLYTEKGIKEKVAELNKDIGSVHSKEGQYQMAIDYYTKSLSQYRSIMSDVKNSVEAFKSVTGEIIKELGMLFQIQGQSELAAKTYLEGLPLLVASDSSEYIMTLIISISNALWMEGNTSKAIEFLDASLPDFSDVDSDERAEIIFMLSFTRSLFYIKQGDFIQAAKYLREARDQAEAMGDEEGQGALLQMFEGVLYRAEGSESWGSYRLQESITNITDMSKELSMFDDNSEDPHLPEVLSIIATYHLARNNREVALQLYLEGLEFASLSGNNLSLARIHRHLATLYRNQGEDSKALDHLEKCLYFSRAHSPHLEDNLGRASLAYSALEDIARLHRARGDYLKAIEVYKGILEDKQRSTKLVDARLYYELAELHYSQRQFVEAIDACRKSIGIAFKDGDLNVLWQAQDLAGLGHMWLEQWEPALESFQSAIETVEKARSLVFGGEEPSQRFFEDKLEPYHHMIGLLISLGRQDRALAFAERSKSRVLLDTLLQGRNKLITLMTVKEREAERGLREKLILLNRAIRDKQTSGFPNSQLQGLRSERLKARLDYEIFRASFLGSHPGVSKLPESDYSMLSVEKAATALPAKDSALLEYVVTENRTYLFVVTRNVPSSERRGQLNEHRPDTILNVYEIDIDRESLEDDVNDYRERVAHPYGVIEPLSQKLYKLLVKPAESQLLGKTILVIVPDQSLWDLPFQTLLNGNGRYLLQDHAVCYEPSVTVLQEIKKRVNQDKVLRSKHNEPGRARPGSRQMPALLVVANPSTADPSLELPESARLAKRLASLYGKSQSRICTGAEASEDRVKDLAKYYRIIHMGVHGVLDNESPMYSHLVLYQARGKTQNSPLPKAEESNEQMPGKLEDGVLEAWELLDVQLNARLVVLTACDTARGRVGAGEGMIGVSWALFLAGCPTSIVSQWKVEELSTSDLFFSFHQSYRNKERAVGSRAGAAVALRQAALRLMENLEYRHPYYWGGFVLLGAIQ